jgi:hypothetical protein
MSNFQFLQTGWPQLFKEAVEAEKLTLTSPDGKVEIFFHNENIWHARELMAELFI